MASGQQLSDGNFEQFKVWLASKTDDDFRNMVNRDMVLSRKTIVAECGFGGSVIHQNPRIKGLLLSKESELRARGILPPLAAKKDAHKKSVDATLIRTSMQASVRASDFDRMHALEIENASLKGLNRELKLQLEKFVVLREALSSTGRLPR